MKSPIKENINNFKCGPLLREKMPRGSVVHSFLFFDGNIEFDLARTGRFIAAHTTKYVIYEFWKCAMEDPKRIAELSQFFFPIEEENIFHILQEEWPKYRDPFVRSALFFLLNRCSESGHISAGKLNARYYNPVALSHLRRFTIDNFHLHLTEGEDFLQGLHNAPQADFILFHIFIT